MERAAVGAFYFDEQDAAWSDGDEVDRAEAAGGANTDVILGFEMEADLALPRDAPRHRCSVM
jgi:hypothetical protein